MNKTICTQIEDGLFDIYRFVYVIISNNNCKSDSEKFKF